ncbi:gamma-carotene 1'-hydroxylase CruF [Dulcicalothrix desertica]|nr:carotenoid biosynthesis protein [Dulcicalothrix desertica]TWH40720.1 putative membrane protein [Dulcicalothrix desertica PCC 7102]
MKQLVIAERVCLTGHILSKAFGLAGILLVIPHAEKILNFGDVGQTAMQLSMANGGVVDIIFGTVAVSIFAFRTLGWQTWLSFMVPAVLISVSSELLGTGTGFPFGDYHYLNGLGYKIAELVPFTIPLSWFYVGLSAYLVARAGLGVAKNPTILRQVGAVLLGAVLFTSWDFALEPAMSQTSLPFWFWDQAGAFYGTPYQNYAGWFGTSTVFMTVAALLWRNNPVKLEPKQLNVPMIVYLSNYAFAAGLSLGAGFVVPVSLGFITGVIPAVLLWWKAVTQDETPSAATEVTKVATAVGAK